MKIEIELTSQKNLQNYTKFVKVNWKFYTCSHEVSMHLSTATTSIVPFTRQGISIIKWTFQTLKTC